MRGLAFERRQSLYVRNRPKESQLARDGRRRMKFQVASIYGREAYRKEKKNAELAGRNSLSNSIIDQRGFFYWYSTI